MAEKRTLVFMVISMMKIQSEQWLSEQEEGSGRMDRGEQQRCHARQRHSQTEAPKHRTLWRHAAVIGTYLSILLRRPEEQNSEEKKGEKGKQKGRGQEERDEWQMVISRVGSVRCKSVIVILLYILHTTIYIVLQLIQLLNQSRLFYVLVQSC